MKTEDRTPIAAMIPTIEFRKRRCDKGLPPRLYGREVVIGANGSSP
jgi:hypothetical protein